jgi:hypothetical protein
LTFLSTQKDGLHIKDKLIFVSIPSLSTVVQSLKGVFG